MAEMFESAFRPLPDTEPVHLLVCRGCRWPVTVEGNILFCDQPMKPGSKISWCERHRKIGVKRVSTANEKANV